MARYVVGLAALARLGAVAIDARASARASLNLLEAKTGVQILEDLVAEASYDFLERAVGAFEAGSRLEEMLTATESGALGNLLIADPDAAAPLAGATGPAGEGLDVLMKVGQIMVGGDADLEKLKALGQAFGEKGSAGGASDLEKLKTLNRYFTGERKKGTPEAEEFLAKKPRSSAEHLQAANVFEGTGAEEVLGQLKEVLGASDDDAVKQLESAVSRQPSKKLIEGLNGLKSFLASVMTSDRRFAPVRELLAEPGAIPKLAGLREAYKEAAKGYAEGGELWGTTDEGFAATARLVLAAQALDGRQHEAFSAESAMALRRYVQDHPEEAQIPLGITKAHL